MNASFMFNIESIDQLHNGHITDLDKKLKKLDGSKEMFLVNDSSKLEAHGGIT